MKHRTHIGIIHHPRYGVLDPDRPGVCLGFDVDMCGSGTYVVLPAEQATAVLKRANCTVDKLEGRLCRVNFEHGTNEFEGLVGLEDALSALNQLLNYGRISWGVLADKEDADGAR